MFPTDAPYLAAVMAKGGEKGGFPAPQPPLSMLHQQEQFAVFAAAAYRAAALAAGFQRSPLSSPDSEAHCNKGGRSLVDEDESSNASSSLTHHHHQPPEDEEIDVDGGTGEDVDDEPVSKRPRLDQVPSSEKNNNEEDLEAAARPREKSPIVRFWDKEFGSSNRRQVATGHPEHPWPIPATN
jgi:hypothetical protein